MLDTIEPHHVEVVLKLMDGIFHGTTKEAVLPYLDEDFPKDRLDEYLKSTESISGLPGALEFTVKAVQSGSLDSIRMFIVLSNILNSRILSFPLTGSVTSINDMTPEQREQLLKEWSNLPISIRRKLYNVIKSIGLLVFSACHPDLHDKAIGFYGKEIRAKLYDTQEIDTFVYDMLAIPEASQNEVHLDVDALIVGLGCGAGVVAHTLSTQGYKCIVIEKGDYYPKLEMTFKEMEGLQKLYQSSAVLTNTSQLMTVLAGSTFGGGSAVNWLASLKTPFKVREEWHKDFGLEWAANEYYDDLQDYVYQKIGATTDNLKHSLTNQKILDGSKKLGYPVKEVPQNNGGHENHSCGFCYLGCKYGVKQGSVECWFKHSPGTEFMCQTRVAKILHSKGKAYGALCTRPDGTEFIIKGPKKFVMCGGSLNTPIVLQHSGFKNKNIGSNLKLHPVSVLHADFGRENKTHPEQEAILTTVCTETADLDGKAHGARIEAILHSPLLESSIVGWRGSEWQRQFMLRYRQLAAFLLITRDHGSGSIHSAEDKPDALQIEYEVSKYDKNALLECLIATAKIAYIEGAYELIPPSTGMSVFKSNKPKEQRLITDKDFTEWLQEARKVGFHDYQLTFGSAHQMSLCRMASTPKKGACDTNGRLYECKNIFVADALSMPTASGVNPMVTTLTFARHIALQIAKDLQPKASL